MALSKTPNAILKSQTAVRKQTHLKGIWGIGEETREGRKKRLGGHQREK